MKVKHMLFKGYIPILVMLLTALTGTAQSFQRSKHYSETMPLGLQADVRISNKYGDITFISWDQDSIRVEVDVIVESDKESKADKFFENIDVVFKQTDYLVSATTEFNKQNKFWEDVSDLTMNVINSSEIASVEYIVYMPGNRNLFVENKYGNIYLPKHQKSLNIQLSNGDFQIGELTADLHLKLEFGSAQIRKMKNGTFELGYAEVDIKMAGELDFQSKSSTIRIDALDVLKLQSRRDKFFIGKVLEITGETMFSQINCEWLMEGLLLRSDYGGVEIEKLDNLFQFVNLQSKYTSISLYMTTTSAANLDVQYDKKLQMSLPVALKKEELISIDKDTERLKGSWGSRSQSWIKIRARGGDLIIMLK